MIGLDAHDTPARLRRSFPALASHSHEPSLQPLLPLARIAVLEADPSDVMPDDWMALRQEQAFDVVFVATERDVKTASAAMRVAALAV